MDWMSVTRLGELREKDGKGPEGFLGAGLGCGGMMDDMARLYS